MTEICLFPIPDCVTFPGTVFPLHVFEPRYRKMIHYCVENNQLLGICHTRKMISPGKQGLSLEQALQSNQATYQPYDIFTAGTCELMDTTDDGRLYLNVHMQQRYRTVSEKQTLPFLIYHCEKYQDKTATPVENKQAEALKKTLLYRLQQLTDKNPFLQNRFSSGEWHDKPVKAFSFEIFAILSFLPELQQQILSMQSASERLQTAIQIIDQM